MAGYARGLRSWVVRRGPGDALLVTLVLAALLETIWIVYLALYLPHHYVAIHWKAAWVGLDVGQVAALLLSAWAAWRRRAVLALFTSSAGTMLLIDAWFDLTTARRGDQLQSLLFAVFLEIPSALALYWVTHRTIRAINAPRMGELGIHSVRQLPIGPIDPRRERSR